MGYKFKLESKTEVMNRCKQEKQQNMNYKKQVEKFFKGFGKEDAEALFNEIIPLYLFQTQRPGSFDPNWKIVNRESGEEFTVDKALEYLRDRRKL